MGSFKCERSESGAQSAPRQGEPGAAGLPADRISRGAAAAERERRRPSRADLAAHLHEPVRRPERSDGQPGRQDRRASTRRTCQHGNSAASLAGPVPAGPVPERDGRHRSSRAWAATSASSSASSPNVGMNVTTSSAVLRARSTATPRSTSCRRSPSWPRRRAATGQHASRSHRAASFRAPPTTRPRPSMFADVARTQFSVDGTGVTVGVLSDSVSQFAGGLADSYETGDLGASNPVNVIQDGPRRLAPTKAARCWRTSTTSRRGPTSQFATAVISELAFARTSRPWPPRPSPTSSSTTSATPTSRCSRTA